MAGPLPSTLSRWAIAGVPHQYTANGGPVEVMFTPEGFTPVTLYSRVSYAGHWARSRLILVENSAYGTELGEIVNGGYKYSGAISMARCGSFARQVSILPSTSAIYLVAEVAASTTAASEYWRNWGPRSIQSLEVKR